METNQQKISVIDPVSPALGRVKTILFQPFDLKKWFLIGFCAWLANLCWGGYNFNFQFGGQDRRSALSDRAREFVSVNPEIIITIVLLISIIAIVLTVLFLWLSSRGRFMFLYCVAQNRAQVKRPWHVFKKQGNSLFLFLLLMSISALILTALFIVPVVLFCFVFKGREVHFAAPAAAALLMLVLILILLAVIFALIFKFTNDFVVPLMYLRGTRCVSAWREFWALLIGNKARFALYILFQILLALIIGSIISFIIFISCCCCCIGIIFFIPYIGTVVLLPVIVFKRSYSLYYFRQFGPAFDLIDVELPQS